MKNIICRSLFFSLIIIIVSTNICCMKEKIHMTNDVQIVNAFYKLKETKIYFGHQSVGQNILTGVSELASELKLDIKIVELKEFQANKDRSTNIIHSYIGENRYPDKKTEEFSNIIQSSISNNIDIALMKFCYVDTEEYLSTEQMIILYLDAIEYLEKKYPNKVFIYTTIPLTARSNNAKNLVKRFLGMPIFGRNDNIERNRFNSILRKKKESTGRLFDLAAIQSTYPDGTKEKFMIDGVEYYAMVPSYSSDGGHLNKLGRNVVAREFIKFFAFEIIK